MEERLQEIERQVAQIRVDRATDAANMIHFGAQMKELSKQLEAATAAINRARGGFWVVCGVAGVVVEVLHQIASYFTKGHQ